MKYKLHYTEVKQKEFYKKETLQKFMMTKAHQIIGIWNKVNGEWHNVPQVRGDRC